jgi:hypothetical protein
MRLVHPRRARRLVYVGNGTFKNCSGMRALTFNVLFNLTLFHQFFGVLGSGSNSKGSREKAKSS